MRKLINFASPLDGTEQQAIVIAPDEPEGRELPLVIVPHAAGWTADGTAGYWWRPVREYGLAAVFPFGHGRKLHLRSSGWEGQMRDLASLPSILQDMGYPIDSRRVYAAGLSMGGTESLLLAGRNPDLIAAVASFNAVVDLAAWFHDCAERRLEIIEEVGGAPEELPEEYAARSPMTYAATIARVPCLLYWDKNDDIVPSQEEKQSGRLYRLVKQIDRDAPIWGYTQSHGHQWIKPRLILDWLLERSR